MLVAEVEEIPVAPEVSADTISDFMSSFGKNKIKDAVREVLRENEFSPSSNTQESESFKNSNANQLAIISERITWIFRLSAFAVTASLSWMGYLTYASIEQGKQLAAHGSLLAGNKLQAITSRPLTKESIKEASSSISDAIEKKVPIPLETVIKSSNVLMKASRDERNPLRSSAWVAALQSISYKTILNEFNEAVPQVPWYEGGSHQSFSFGFLNKRDLLNFSIGDNLAPKFLSTNRVQVPMDYAARYEPLDSSANKSLASGVQFLRVEFKDMPLKIDNYFIKNVVIMNTEVHYQGGAVVLENVYFLNCKFVMDNEPNTRSLGEYVLVNSSVSLKLNSKVG